MRYCVIFLLGLIVTPLAQAKVLLLGSLHQFHSKNHSYSYEALYQLVEEFEPDLVAIEIREEDMASDRGWLERHYPREMVELKSLYGSSAVGIDWFAKEVEGQPLPDDYFKTSDYHRLRENEPGDYPGLGPIMEAMVELILSGSPAEIMDGRYSALKQRQLVVVETAREGTPYELLSAMDRERDRQMARRVISLIQANPGKNIAVVVGLDHHGAMTRQLKRFIAPYREKQLVSSGRSSCYPGIHRPCA